MKKGGFLFWIIALLGLLWIFTPFCLGFTPGQTARWANPVNAPRILDEWWMDRTDGSRISITRQDGTKTVITRDRYGESVAEYGADGKRIENTENTDQERIEYSASP